MRYMNELSLPEWVKPAKHLLPQEFEVDTWVYWLPDAPHGQPVTLSPLITLLLQDGHSVEHAVYPDDGGEFLWIDGDLQSNDAYEFVLLSSIKDSLNKGEIDATRNFADPFTVSYHLKRD
jgi:hypothetical protein